VPRDVHFDGRPCANSAAPLSKAGIAYDSRFNCVVALRYQIIAQYFVDKPLFSLALDMN
jgi:hypothetical protein